MVLICREMRSNRICTESKNCFGIAGAFYSPEVPSYLEHLTLQPASELLLEKIRKKGILVRIARPGSEDYDHLKSVGAVGVYRRALIGLGEIVLVQNPTKIAALEEYLHAMQDKIGLLDSLETVMAEVHVKDFMLRHAKRLSLSENDVTVLKELKKKAIEKLKIAGYKWVNEK